jgi:hypothetical protein
MKLTFMKSIMWKALFVLGISLVLIYGFTTPARQGKYHESLTPPSLLEWTNSEDGLLSVCFAVDKTTFSKNEAFSIRCAVRNNTDKTLTILRPFGDEFYSLSSGLHILGPTGSVTYRGAWKDYVLGTDSFHELAPHTVIDETLEIPNNLFPGIQNPGLYKIDYIYVSSGHPRKTKPDNYWEGKVIGNSVILLRQGSALPKDTAQPEISDLNKAVSVGVAKLAEKIQAPAEYKLIGAQQIYYNGKYVWRTTFKPTKLLPADPSAQLIGKGGEVFINIDLETKETVITYGE